MVASCLSTVQSLLLWCVCAYKLAFVVQRSVCLATVLEDIGAGAGIFLVCLFFSLCVKSCVSYLCALLPTSVSSRKFGKLSVDPTVNHFHVKSSHVYNNTLCTVLCELFEPQYDRNPKQYRQRSLSKANFRRALRRFVHHKKKAVEVTRRID